MPDLTVVLGILLILWILFTAGVIFWVRKKFYWYENILDHIPMPLSVTDANKNWKLVNKALMELQSVKRSELIGKPCRNWDSTYEQNGKTYKVMAEELGGQAGYIRFLSDVTDTLSGYEDDAKFIEDINDICGTVTRTSNNIDSGANELAQNSALQVEEVSALSGDISSVAAQTQSNTTLAGKASDMAEVIKGDAEKGSAQMDKLALAVEDINNSIQSISKVFKFIDDIAFQTNILALNAAVEAARAGQHGKGFAVVAEEVRNLAAKSAASAKDTGSIITESMEKARMGVEIAGETSKSFKGIVSGVDESSRIAKEILHSCTEQDRSIDKINSGIDMVLHGIQKNSAMAQESAAACAEIREQTDHLKRLIDEFEEQVKSFYEDAK